MIRVRFQFIHSNEKQGNQLNPSCYMIGCLARLLTRRNGIQKQWFAVAAPNLLVYLEDVAKPLVKFPSLFGERCVMVCLFDVLIQ